VQISDHLLAPAALAPEKFPGNHEQKTGWGPETVWALYIQYLFRVGLKQWLC